MDERSLAPAAPNGGELLPQAVADEMAALRADFARVMSVLVAQQAELSRLTQALATVRVSRAQEKTLCDAIRQRARGICVQYGLPDAAWRRVATAIRATLREATGARAIGDLQAAQFERAKQMIDTWHMAGAIRRICRSLDKEA